MKPRLIFLLFLLVTSVFLTAIVSGAEIMSFEKAFDKAAEAKGFTAYPPRKDKLAILLKDPDAKIPLSVDLTINGKTYTFRGNGKDPVLIAPLTEK